MEPASLGLPSRRDTAASARAVALLVVGGTLFVAGVLLSPRVTPAPHVPVRPLPALALLSALLVAALLVARLPRHGVTRIVTAMTLCNLVLFGLDVVATALGPGWPARMLNVVAAPAWAGTLPMLPLLIAVFPSGRPRWRRVFRVQVAAIAILVAASTAGVDPETAAGPFAVGAVWAVYGAALVLLVTGVVNAGALGVRWRRTTGPERAQLAWFTLGAVILAAAYIALALARLIFDRVPSGLVDELLNAYLIGGLPTLLGIAVLRHRLYGIDVVVGRVLVWLAVSAVLLGLYGATASLAAAVLGTPAAPSLPALLGVGVVALVLAPVYRLVQAVVDRLMYGERGHPERALRTLAARLGGTLAADEVPARVVAAVTSALRVSWAALDARQEDGYARLAEHGTPRGTAEAVPVLHGGTEVGRLLVCPRRGEARLSRRDLRVLGQLATPTGAALHAGRLTDELARSRERLVLGREEERQRLRRDLHDNLSPALSGIALAAAAARGCLGADPAAAERLLERIQQEATASAGAVGRLLTGLRPAGLDELGLAGALRERIRTDDGLAATAVAVDIDEPLPAMSPAVELAAYRVAVEGFSNVLRHAHAGHCRVRIAGDGGHLAVEVTDDGRGMPVDLADGVGLSSVRERAREVGGSVTVRSHRGGTVLSADLPLRGGP